MEPAERLAAFLADELSADEHRAVEAELARDADLRAQLAAMRRADEALTAQAATPLPDGARERLLEALRPTLDERLGAGTQAPAASARRDELARRRRAASRRTWLTAAGGVAAAVAAVAIVGPALTGSAGSGDTADVASEAGGGEAATSASDDGAASDDSAAILAAPVGPTLLGSERAIDEEAASELLAAGELEAVIDQGLAVEEAAQLGEAWADAFGAERAHPSNDLEAYDSDAALSDGEAGQPSEGGATESTEGSAPVPEAGADTADEEADLPAAARDRARASAADLQILGDVDAEDRADVGRCLGTLLEAGGVVVPVLAELVTFGGEPAIAYALVGVAPDDTVTRREVWVLARESCETRYLRQG